MVEWLVFLNNNPYRKGEDDGWKPIAQAFKNMNLIASTIENCEKKLKDDRQETENKCMDEEQKLKKGIKTAESEFSTLMTKNIKGQAEQFVG